MMRRWGLLGILVTGLVVLTGCSPVRGPLVGLNQDITECVVSSMYDDIAVGVVLHNSGSQPLRLRDVSFGTGPGISVEGMWVAGSDHVGIEEHGYGITAFPPDTEFTPGWVDRVDAIGAVIPANTVMFLVVHLHEDDPAVPGDPRRFSGMRIAYAVDRLPLVATSNFIAGFGVDGDCELSGDDADSL